MHCLWLQGQMADLLIFKKQPELIQPFLANPEKVPMAVATLRAEYWEGEFGPLKKEFSKYFRDQMSAVHIADLDYVYYLRNAIAHSHVSIGRDFLLYRPGRGGKGEQEMIDALGLKPVVDQANPLMVSIRLYDDAKYLNDFNRIKRLDGECFSEIATSLGLRHSRIR